MFRAGSFLRLRDEFRRPSGTSKLSEKNRFYPPWQNQFFYALAQRKLPARNTGIGDFAEIMERRFQWLQVLTFEFALESKQKVRYEGLSGGYFYLGEARLSFLILLFVLEALCGVGVVADYYLKLSGGGPNFVNITYFVIGFVLHCSTAVGWFLVLKYMKLSQVGVYYSISIVLMLSLIGVIQFNEQLAPREICGIILAIASICLLGKYA